MNRLLITVFVFSMCALPQFGMTQTAVSVQSEVDRNQILIGDVFNYSIVVTHDDSIELQMPPAAANLGAFEIRDYEVSEPVREKDQIVEKTRFLLSTFDTGEFEIPQLPVQYRASGDSAWQTIYSEPILITVVSLNPDSTGDIRDIKPPLTPPRDVRAIIKWSVAGFFFLLVVAFLIYYLKRRREGKSLLPTRAKPPRPAHEIALEALDELVQSDLLAKGNVKEYYSRLSDTIRQYIENRYYIPALEMTTTQLLAEMEKANLLDTNIQLMADFLATADLVKFAAYVPDEETHQQKTKMAYDFVHSTKLILSETEKEQAESVQENAAVEENTKEEEHDV